MHYCYSYCGFSMTIIIIRPSSDQSFYSKSTLTIYGYKHVADCSLNPLAEYRVSKGSHLFSM